MSLINEWPCQSGGLTSRYRRGADRLTKLLRLPSSPPPEVLKLSSFLFLASPLPSTYTPLSDKKSPLYSTSSPLFFYLHPRHSFNAVFPQSHIANVVTMQIFVKTRKYSVPRHRNNAERNL